MEIFGKLPGRPLNARQVASTMGIADSDIRDMLHVLMREQAGKGVLVEVGKGRFMLPEQGGRGGRNRDNRGRRKDRKPGDRPQHGDVVTGTIQITKYGKGFVSVPGESEDIMLPKGNTGTAFWGDTVEVGWMNRGRRKVPYVARVVKRARELYVVMLQPVKDYALASPPTSAFTATSSFPPGSCTTRPPTSRWPSGSRIGPRPTTRPSPRWWRCWRAPGVHEAEMHAILLEYGLPYHFPEDVEAEAETIPKDLDPKEIQRRRDMRDVTTFTIDPEDAKDFDDALSVRDLDSGHLEVGVHIADVTHYVRPGSRIEEEAVERATSVYLVDRTSRCCQRCCPTTSAPCAPTRTGTPSAPSSNSTRTDRL